MGESLVDKLLGRRKEALAKDRSFRDAGASYAVVRYMPQAVPNREQSYSLSGDTIFCAELNISMATYIKIGIRENPWIRLRKGFIYKRKFNRFAIRTFGNNLLGDIPNDGDDAILYVTTGDFVTPSFEEWNGNPICLSDCVAIAAAPTDWLLSSVAFLNGGITLTSGKINGVAYITNLSTVDILYFGVGGITTVMFPILPRTTFSFNLSKRFATRLPTAGGSGFPNLYAVRTDVNPVPYAVAIFPFEADTTDVVYRGELLSS